MKRFNIRFRQVVMNLAVIMLLFIPSITSAQNGQGGLQSNFNFGFGAKAMGMGSAFTALANDPSAVHWNPAGLESIYQQSVTLFHASLYEGVLYDFLGYAYPTLDLGTFGLGIARIGVGGIPETDINGDPLGEFSMEHYRVYLSYAKQLPWGLTAGTSIKVERMAFIDQLQNGDDIGMGVGMDLGIMYRPDFSDSPLLRDWSIGMNIQNLFSPQIKAGETADILPIDIRFGLMRTLHFVGPGNSLNILLDIDKSANTDLGIHFGTEYSFQQLGKVRVGFDGGGIAFGAGMQYDMFQIDYAFGNPSTDGLLDPVHRISLSVNFGLNRDEMFDIVKEIRQQEEEKIIADIREADKQKFVAEHFQNANDYFGNDNFLDAIVEYQQVLSADPFNQRAKVMLDSSNALLQQDFENQQSLAVQSALDKDRAEADRAFVDQHYGKGRTLLDQKQFTLALIEFNMALDRDKENETVKAAIQTTKRRLNEEVGSLVQKGREEFQKENYSESLRLLSEARLLSENDEQIKKEVDTLVQRVKLQENIQKGLMLYDIGEFDSALDMFQNVLEEDPDNQFIKQYYEKTKVEAHGTDDKMDPETERRYLEGVDKFLLGQYSEAIQIWENILQTHPYNKKVLNAVKDARERVKRSENN